MTSAPVALLLQTLVLVGPQTEHPSLAAGIEAAHPGDTVVVTSGIYREHAVLGKPLVLMGEPGAVLDGGGRGTILTVTATATIRGLTFRNSGDNQSREDSGIMVIEAPGTIIADNRLEEVLFGVYLKQTDSADIKGNDIHGKDLPMPLRGDGIRLWYSHDGVVTDNRVERTRDVVIWFSNDTQVRRNVVVNGRYGLHYMYSDRNRFEDNEFLANEVGAFIMYSNDILFENNVFASAKGATGRGLGFKDSDRITAIGNLLIKNAVGISIDNSPQTRGVVNRFENNVIAYNDVAVSILPSVRSNRFERNRFLHNVHPIRVTGGGTALANGWHQNYWSDYVGFDSNEDGIGDTPFRHERLTDDLMAKYEELSLFESSLALTVLNVVSRVLPSLKPRPLLVDSLPQAGSTETPLLAGTPKPLDLSVLGILAVTTLTLITLPLMRLARRRSR